MSDAISKRSTTDLGKMKAFLAIDASTRDFDILLNSMLLEAKSLADAYCSNDFEDADGNCQPIPHHVENWIKRTVARWFSIPENGLQNRTVASEGSVTYGPVDYTALFQGWKPFI